ncbi:uncharacterized protein [Centruroides vittatus]|uniref:uncharacterized protein n=1 Tax=Centruroides vittatus TaxID=120091 RepID=UPI00350F1DE8
MDPYAKLEGRHTMMVTIDFKGAFDHAWWPAILSTLIKTNCPANILKLLRSFLSEREVMAIETGKIHYRSFISRGCPQGSKSGPLLWNILYNGLLNITKGTNLNVDPYIQGYADDTAILLSHHNHDTLQTYTNNLLKLVHKWSEENKLIINYNKCNCIVFPKGNPLQKRPSIKINNQKIQWTNNIKYLGLILDPKLTWRDHIHYTYDKAVRVNHALRCIARNYWGLNHQNSRTIYKGAVEPILTYGCEVWGHAVAKTHIRRKLLSAQRTSAIAITKSYRTAPTDALLVIAGLLPIHLTILYRYIKNLFIKMITADINQDQLHKHISDLKLPDLTHSLVNEIVKNGIDLNTKMENKHPANNISSNFYLKETSIPNGLNFFTDGSKTSDDVGASVCLEDSSKRNFWQAVYKLHKNCSINQAESLAIFNSLKYIHTNIQWLEHRTINIISDSRIALHQIKNENVKLPIIENSLKLIYALEDSTKINFYWIRGHSGNVGNDKADHLAKKAKDIATNCNHSSLPMSYLCSKLNNIIMDRWQNEWDKSNTGRITHEFIPNVNNRMFNKHLETSHALTQIMTAHGNFKAYLCRFLKKGNGLCDCGVEGDDPHHLIFTCTKYVTHRSHLRQLVEKDGHHWPCKLNTFIDNRKIFRAFTNFVHNLNLMNYQQTFLSNS